MRREPAVTPPWRRREPGGRTGSYRLGRAVRFRIVGGHGVAVHQGTGEVVGVDEVGALVLRLAGAGLGVEAILAELSTTYDVEDMAAARADVERFMAKLAATGILEAEG